MLISAPLLGWRLKVPCAGKEPGRVATHTRSLLKDQLDICKRKKKSLISSAADSSMGTLMSLSQAALHFPPLQYVSCWSDVHAKSRMIPSDSDGYDERRAIEGSH